MRAPIPTIAMALCALLISAHAAGARGLQDDVDQAATIIQRFYELPETAIPKAVMRNARGLAIMTVFKAGFGVSGQGGKGVVVARTAHGWSGPSAIGTGGGGFGLQIGAAVTEFVIVLNTDAAVRAFSQGGNVTIGADVSVVAGPVGRDLAAGVMPLAAIYTYSNSQGLFAGMSLQGAVIATRDTANQDYYGRKVTGAEILSGRVPAPARAAPLLEVLTKGS
jgi:lipid-binding SYLF domain-containing protein